MTDPLVRVGPQWVRASAVKTVRAMPRRGPYDSESWQGKSYCVVAVIDKGAGDGVYELYFSPEDPSSETSAMELAAETVRKVNDAGIRDD